VIRLSHQKTAINSDKYGETLEELCKASERKRPGRLTAGVRLLRDGARPHTSTPAATFFGKFCAIHPPHSPDAVPLDSYLSGPIKNFISGRRYEDHNAMQYKQLRSSTQQLERYTTVKEHLRPQRNAVKTVAQFYTTIGKEHYREGMFEVVKRRDKCLNDNGDCMGKFGTVPLNSGSRVRDQMR
jgi:hypothetical protein